MSIRIIKESEFIQSEWSGGTTTQLFISPENSSLLDRNFDFRISTANVNVENSDFTLLPGYERKLMILKGKLSIKHVNHYSIDLNEFEKDHFLGDWETKGIGKVKDFNVIFKPEIEPILSHVNVYKNDTVLIESPGESFLYVFKGIGKIGKDLIETGELVRIQKTPFLNYIALEESDLIIVNVAK